MIQCPLCFRELGEEVEMDFDAGFDIRKGTIEVWVMCPKCLVEYEGSLK